MGIDSAPSSEMSQNIDRQAIQTEVEYWAKQYKASPPPEFQYLEAVQAFQRTTRQQKPHLRIGQTDWNTLPQGQKQELVAISTSPVAQTRFESWFPKQMNDDDIQRITDTATVLLINNPKMARGVQKFLAEVKTDRNFIQSFGQQADNLKPETGTFMQALHVAIVSQFLAINWSPPTQA